MNKLYDFYVVVIDQCKLKINLTNYNNKHTNVDGKWDK